MTPLITEAMKKAAISWLRVGEHSPVLVWLVWLDDAAYVVHGGAEQRITGLAEASRCDVLTRSADNGAHIVTWEAAVHHVVPGSPEWEKASAALIPKRLNLPDLATAPARWAATCAISMLRPVDQGGAPGEASVSYAREGNV